MCVAFDGYLIVVPVIRFSLGHIILLYKKIFLAEKINHFLFIHYYSKCVGLGKRAAVSVDYDHTLEYL